MRKTQLVNGEWYHIYNRGSDEREIFLDEEDYLKFLRGLKDFNNRSFYEERARIVNTYGLKELSSFLEKVEKVVHIAFYSLVPNHHHFILRQLTTNGIPLLMHKLGTSYTNYFNKKYGRSGSLFQGPYKTIHIDNNDYLLWLSGYVNGNIEIHKLGEAETYPWSSFGGILKSERSEILSGTEIVLSQFKDIDDYKKFVKIVIEESRKRKDLEKYLLEKLEKGAKLL
ncbi:MAG: transposase [Candidatus Nealsonbacteria bacterium]|nr:transposase [Candidatus Nealsonbacteria bacterium]